VPVACDAIDHEGCRPEPGRDPVVARLAQHDAGDRRPPPVDPADRPEREAAAGCGGRAGLDADEPAVPEQPVGVVHRAGGSVALAVATMRANTGRRIARSTRRTWSAAVDTVASS